MQSLFFLSLLTSTLAIALPQSGGNGLSFEVPPPACLDTCIHQLGYCNLCIPGNTYGSCISRLCGYKDYSYASAYLGSICSDGGYVSYDTNPSQDIYIATDPRTDCAAPSNGTTCQNA